MNKIVSDAHPHFGGSGQTRVPAQPRVGNLSNEKVALYVMMAVASSMFFLFILAFLIRSTIGDWDALSQPWNPLSHRGQLWLNTSMLLSSSLAFEYARRSARQQDERGILIGLMLAGLFAVSFLIGQLWIWQGLIEHGYYMNSNPANSFFYVFTALHGAHLIVGLAFWNTTMSRAWAGKSPEQVANITDLCAVFWHFLFALWLILFGLLAGPPETIALIASYCGII